MKSFEQILDDYNYDFPKELIAQRPADPRDSAQLMAYDMSSHKVSFDVFSNIDAYLPDNSLIVINETKVLPARLKVKKVTGGVVELLYVAVRGELIEALTNRKVTPGSKLSISDDQYFIVDHCEQAHVWLRPSFPMDQFYDVLEQFGAMPLPPYIKNSPLNENELRQQYQTVFARQHGSVAAPTASLHFTDALLEKLKQQGHEVVKVILHVNLGTFAPLSEEQHASGRLHEEYFSIDREAGDKLQKAKLEGQPIIAVGTTVVRTLESAFKDPSQPRLSGSTDMFIRPGYKFQMVDGLITNFHIPRSSLLMLVSALTGREKLLELYKSAIDKKFRLFSFGDAMLILP